MFRNTLYYQLVSYRIQSIDLHWNLIDCSSWRKDVNWTYIRCSIYEPCPRGFQHDGVFGKRYFKHVLITWQADSVNILVLQNVVSRMWKTEKYFSVWKILSFFYCHRSVAPVQLIVLLKIIKLTGFNAQDIHYSLIVVVSIMEEEAKKLAEYFCLQ